MSNDKKRVKLTVNIEGSCEMELTLEQLTALENAIDKGGDHEDLPFELPLKEIVNSADTIEVTDMEFLKDKKPKKAEPEKTE